MNKEFIPYEQALELKELGFDEPCMGYYIELKNPIEGLLKIGLDNEYLQAPLYQQAFRWFRKNKIHSSVSEFDINNYMYYIDDGIWRDIEVPGYDTYEEAELACLTNLIEVVKENRQ
jgi:hypothetical protein